MHKEYEKYNKALNKFVEYKAGIDTRIETLKSSIRDKESQADQMASKYATDFIEGKETSDKKLQDLRIDIETNKEQLRLVEDAYKVDHNIKTLGKEVYKEYDALRIQIDADLIADSEKLKELEDAYKLEKEKLIKESNDRKEMIRVQYIEPRVAISEYMSMPQGELNHMKAIALY